MNDSSDNLSAAPDEAISITEIAIAILRSWRTVLVLPVLFGLAAGLWSYTRDRRFVATASIIQKGAESRAAGGAAALAQQFGVSLGGDRSAESPQFYVDLLSSKTLLRQAVEATYEIPARAGRPWRGTLIQYWKVEGDGLVPAWLRAAAMLDDAVAATVNRETGVLQLTVTSDNGVLAEQIANKLLELLNEFNLEVRQGRAQDEGRFIRGRVTEAQSQLNAAEVAVRDFLRRNRQFQNAPELVLEHDRLQRQVMMRQEVYTSGLRSQEQAHIDAIRDTPLFTVIDRPDGAAVPQSRGTVAKALIAFVVGLLLSVLVALVREFVRRRGAAGGPHHGEFHDLRRQVWNDLRDPRRWLRREASLSPPA